MPDLSLKRAGSRIQVHHAPYNAEFVVAAHELDGRWKKRSQVWSFPSHNYPKLAEVCNRLYGTDFKVK